MRDILLHGKRTYGELAASEEGISTNILANRLARLEAEGMVNRTPDPRKGSRICYFPTRKLRDLLPALLALMVWSTRYDERTDAPESFAKAYLADPKACIDYYEDGIDAVDREILGPPSVS